MKKILSALLLVAIFITMLPVAYAQAASPAGQLKIYSNGRDLSHKTYELDTITERSIRLEALNSDSLSEEKVIWKSSNEALASVDKNGLVTINTLQDGSVTIFCHAADSFGRSCSVKLILYKRVHGLSLEHYSNYSMRSESIVSLSPRYLSPLGLDYTPTNPQLQWEVIEGGEFAYFSNPSSGTLCTNAVTKTETVKIRLCSADNPRSAAYMYVTVNPTVRSISLFRAGLDVSGQEFNCPVAVPVLLSAKATPEQNLSIIWSSSSTSAKVSEGLVTASAPCSVIITAAAADGSGVSSSVTINFM